MAGRDFHAMLDLFRSLASSLCSSLKSRRDLALENLALRQQLAVLRRQVRRAKLTPADRLFWVWLMRVWAGWQDSLLVVQPETVIRWFRAGFRRYWTWKSRRRAGRPGLDPEVRALISRMATANPLWGTPRVHGELQ